MFLSIIDFNFEQTFKFIFNLKLNFLVGISGIYFIGYLVGKNLWRLKKKSAKFKIVHGIVAIFLVLVIGTIIGSTVGFLEEGLPHSIKYGNLLYELFAYYFKPMYWILLFGSLPTLVSGIVLGIFLKKNCH